MRGPSESLKRILLTSALYVPTTASGDLVVGALGLDAFRKKRRSIISRQAPQIGSSFCTAPAVECGSGAAAFCPASLLSEALRWLRVNGCIRPASCPWVGGPAGRDAAKR